MEEFTPITTQEELNSVIGKRILRERETVTREFEAQISEKDGEIAKYRTDLDDLNKKLEEANEKVSGIPALEDRIRAYEKASVKSRVARDVGIPWELAERLSGETEDEIRKDAEEMRKLIGAARPAAPLKNTESGAGKDKMTQAWASVAQELKGD